MSNVTIYSTPTCEHCKATKAFLKEHNVTYTDYDVSVDQARAKEMIEKSEQMAVPVILIDDEMVLGFNEQKLRELLHIA
ncbi:glutaredoxin family protein [Candidatus Parcubacteria bacterium]|nr:glutaredoxin family protein [Candidatus Parcubacteria bacterium]